MDEKVHIWRDEDVEFWTKQIEARHDCSPWHEGLRDFIRELHRRIAAAKTEGIRIGFEGARKVVERFEHDDPYEVDKYETVEELLKEREGK